MAHSMYPNSGLQFLSACIHFLGVSMLAFFVSRRLAAVEGWSRLTLARWCVLLILVDSYLFILSTGLLIFGVGLQANKYACEAGIFLCVAFYTTSKIFIYIFLMEKVHIVWSTTRRLRSPVYLTCLATLCVYVGAMLLMFLGRIGHFRAGDGACVIGLKPFASLPLLSYDVFTNALLTALFIWPLFRLPDVSSTKRLRRVATRTLVASIASLLTSTVNITILTVLHGREFGWVCLGSCGADVIFNAAAVFWVTSGGSSGIGSADRSPTSTQQDKAEVEGKIKPFRLSPTRPPPREFQIHVTSTTVSDTASQPMHISDDHSRHSDDVSDAGKRESKTNSEKTFGV